MDLNHDIASLISKMLDPTATCLSGISADVLHRLVVKLPFPNYCQSVGPQAKTWRIPIEGSIHTEPLWQRGAAGTARRLFFPQRGGTQPARHCVQRHLASNWGDIRHTTSRWMQVVMESYETVLFTKGSLVYCSLMIYMYVNQFVLSLRFRFLHVMPLPWWDKTHKTLAWCKNQVVPQPWRVVPLEEITNLYIL